MQSYFNAVKSSITGPQFFWVFFYGSVLVAWWLLVAMAADMPGFGIMHFTAPQLWEALCLSAAEADPFALFGMWAVMSVAMMFPTFVPSLRTYLDLRNTGAWIGRAGRLKPLGFLNGLFAVVCRALPVFRFQGGLFEPLPCSSYVFPRALGARKPRGVFYGITARGALFGMLLGINALGLCRGNHEHHLDGTCDGFYGG